MRFKVLAGGHFQNDRLFHKDEVVTTDDPLDTMFKGKFERVAGFKVKEKKPKKSKTGKSKKKETPDTDTAAKGVLADEGFDYDPEDTGLHVYRRGSAYYVYDIEDMENALNEKALKKAGVLEFIESQCEG